MTNMPSATRHNPILFDDFIVGASLGSHQLEYDAALTGHWQRIFGTDPLPQAQAASMAVVLMMRAFLAVVSPRPPGNIHAKQWLQLGSMPVPGDRVTTTLRCRSKEIRRERRYVELEARAENQRGEFLFLGVLTLVWAA
ncbi:MAG: hypothetical protein AB7E12_06900 [Burkholderiaceae bacterium]